MSGMVRFRDDYRKEVMLLLNVRAIHVSLHCRSMVISASISFTNDCKTNAHATTSFWNKKDRLLQSPKLWTQREAEECGQARTESAINGPPPTRSYKINNAGRYVRTSASREDPRSLRMIADE
ncbi:hypothetical protein KP509_13G042100 [Ceratopteris richardii]|uniref:Uncharacterized protein n=1 Tax=Ceratopteris richardii TaxID=49495 RepID=A0A8T2TEZ1_CERRI|nr:hypothetical protein KP509_13G042100 [Ceratopteris richardii]